ncbi:hypothetical protein HPP92_018246 [Vanilla planifolia]|uniref:1-deoxy-D-xylulose-5-phosphate synthase n=1 Tax=Vanilla planifolia TaxID=51239 RepID=A0A835QHP1_VANPL|nr:hypothetical protein HPP92_018246 [Vanilla planifolia]
MMVKATGWAVNRPDLASAVDCWRQKSSDLFQLHVRRRPQADNDRRAVAEKVKSGWTADFTGEKPATPLLDTINYPIHMKNLTTQELEQLTAELRAEIVHTVSKTGGHLSSSLGVVELAVAIHHVFNAPQDKVIWDVLHRVISTRNLQRESQGDVNPEASNGGLPVSTKEMKASA